MWLESYSWWSITAGLLGVSCVLAIILLIFFLIALKIYLIITCGVCRSKASMTGKTVLITGCTGGIGKETARDLTRRGARVILACRDLDAAQRLRDELTRDIASADVRAIRLDLCSQRSVREAAKEVRESERVLHVLVHNAGTAETRARVTEDGLERTMATNHFGPFLFTLLLVDLLKKTPGSRIVIVASMMHFLASLDLQRLNPVNTYVPVYQYFVSKLVNMVWAAELSRRLRASGADVTVNCLHPGMIRTDIYRNVWWPMRWIMDVVMFIYFKTPVQGAQTSIHCAVSEDLNGITGRYFFDCKEYAIPRRAALPATAKKLWELSEQLINLQDDDPKI